MRRTLLILAALAVLAVGLVAGISSVRSDGESKAKLQLPRIPGKVIDVTAATTCTHGYSRSVRPRSSYTTALKRKQMEQWQLPGSTEDYEEDHLIPLSIGGDPRSPENLWPEPRSQAKQSDPYEFELYGRVCNQGLSLQEAQRAIVDYKHEKG